MELSREQRALVDAAHRTLFGDPQIEALWLAGSLGDGRGDTFSDVDLLVLVVDGTVADVAQRYARNAATIAEPALVNQLYGGRILNVVTQQWQRFDITFVESGELGRFDGPRLTNVFNKGTRSPAPLPTQTYRAQPDRLLKLVYEFLRVLGLSVVVMGREEYLVGLKGVELLRQMTIDLMLEENGVGPAQRGGALHLNALLTSPQREALENLAPISASRERIMAASGELAGIFLPRARELAARVAMEWPDAFEAATRRHLRERLNFSLPD
jgi:hypothetical protein